MVDEEDVSEDEGSVQSDGNSIYCGGGKAQRRKVTPSIIGR